MKIKLTFIILLLLAKIFMNPMQNFAKDFNLEEIKKNLPKMLGASNEGREFYITAHPAWENEMTYLIIYITSKVKTKATVEVEGKNIKRSVNITPYETNRLSLTVSQSQCYRKTDRDPPQVEQVFKGFGVHVYSNDPIICYGVSRTDYSSDGYLALPVSDLGNEYIVASYPDPSPNTIQWLPSYTSIVAPYDNTNVTFTLGGNDKTSTAGGLKPGESKIWSMNKGDVLLVAGLGSHADLTGSRIVGTKPISVISGHFCAYIPIDNPACDYTIEQELPTNLWGTQYHVTNIINRKFDSWLRIFAKEPNTTIYRDGNYLGTIKNAGGREGTGFLSLRADEGPARPIVITSDKPCGVTQYNTGYDEDKVAADPFQMVLYPCERYQKEIIFNTPGIRGDWGFKDNYVNLVYEATQNGEFPDDFMFAEAVKGEFVWEQLKKFDSLPGQEFIYPINNKRYFAKTIRLPHDGVYKLKANAPFAAYSYGFSSWDSYGFPTSVMLKDLTKNDSIPPKPDYKQEEDGSVGILSPANVIDLPEDNANRANLSDIYMHTDLSYNYTFIHSNFMPREDREATWSLEVIDKSKEALAVITFTDCVGNDTTIAIEFTNVDVKKESNSNIEIKPNPADAQMIISFNGEKQTGACLIKLFDILGNNAVEKIENLDSENGRMVLNTSQLAEGIYFLRIIIKEQVITKKIVIVH